MKKLLVIFLFPLSLFAQTFDSAINSEVFKVNKDSIQKYLQEFENLGIKQPGTQALINTANWLENYYINWGYIVKRDTFSYAGSELYNLVIDIKGTENPNQILIVDGHYDTVSGPGVNDNGTGTAILLELARILKTNPPKSTVRIIHFSGEEDGLIGSTHYVNNTLTEKKEQVTLVLNIDEVGGVKGLANNVVVCEYDNSSPTNANLKSSLYTDTLITLTELYSSLKTQKAVAYSSDYMPFQDKDYVITGFFEANETPYAHSINDSLKYVDLDYVTEIAKATVAASIYFMRNAPVTGVFKTILDMDVSVSIIGNSVKIENLHNKNITYSIYNIQGGLIDQQTIKSSSKTIDLFNQSKGIYLLHLIDENQKSKTVKFINQ